MQLRARVRLNKEILPRSLFYLVYMYKGNTQLCVSMFVLDGIVSS